MGIVYMTKQTESDTLSGRDRPTKILDEMVFEIRSWDFDRDLTETELAERLFDLANGIVCGVLASEDPNLRRDMVRKVRYLGA